MHATVGSHTAGDLWQIRLSSANLRHTEDNLYAGFASLLLIYRIVV